MLKRFVRSDWLAREPDVVAQEGRALELAASAPVPTPELVAIDAYGEHCDVPALLMRRLPGRLWLEPPDLDSWLTALAEPLPAIHAVNGSLAAGIPPYRCYSDPSRLEPPVWSREPRAWARALDHVRRGPPQVEVCFIHRDYHPTNILWQRGRLSGVLDWTNASRGSVGVDLGHCRLNLVQLYGVGAADHFAAAYCARTGYRMEPYWDLITLIECLPEPEVYRGWSELGMRLDVARIRARLGEYAARLVSLL